MRYTDTERLEWLVANDASFGTSSRLADVVGDRPIWHDARFVRVPCRHLYEWHCYDGTNWREALDNAMASTPCAEHAERGCVNGSFAPDERDHPLDQALAETASKLKRIRQARDEYVASTGVPSDDVLAYITKVDFILREAAAAPPRAVEAVTPTATQEEQ